MLGRRFLTSLGLLAALTPLAAAPPARADGPHPNGAAILRVLGPHAERAFSPNTGRIGALVALPPGVRGASIGVTELSPGIGRVRGSAGDIIAFAASNPGLHVEVAPPLRTLLDNATVYTNSNIARSLGKVDGAGVLVGVADTGLDVTHPDFLDDTGHSRVAWMLDLSLAPLGVHPDLEAKFGIKDKNGVLVAGAVLTGADIDKTRPGPQDEVGHGTHVASIAAGNGGSKPHTSYTGMAPGAQLLIARVSGPGSESIGNDELVTGVDFLFDRADAMKLPVVVNLSLGSDFGPHDGSMLWEQQLASHVGPDKPGHALVVAAGNSGSIVDNAIHQIVHATEGTKLRVPIRTRGATSGGIQVWVAIRPGAGTKVGLDGPDGEWIAPVGDNDQKGRNQDGYSAGIFHGSDTKDSPIPKGSRGAVVVWQGKWPAGQYAITLDGGGTVDMFLQATGDAQVPGDTPVGFLAGVREGTINLPASHPNIISVGCTVNRPRWTSLNKGDVGLRVPVLDGPGGSIDSSHSLRDLVDGEICWFSSAGPNVNGVPKPEITAPGGIVVAAMSTQAKPGTQGSIFTNPSCPPVRGSSTPDAKCLQVDATHAVAVGTSMSSPVVSGVVALLLQKDPTLTQDKIAILLQAGAHRVGATRKKQTDADGNALVFAPFLDQAGPGEVDALGALDALDQMQNPQAFVPNKDKSWLSLSSDYASADGSIPLTVIYELRTGDGQHRADLFDQRRLVPYTRINTDPGPTGDFVRKGPGLWVFTVRIPPGFGGSSLTIGATFDGADIVEPRTIAISTDPWSAEYSSRAKGGCAVSGRRHDGPAAWLAIVGLPLVGFGAWRRRREKTR